MVPSQWNPFNAGNKKSAMTCNVFYRHPVDTYAKTEWLVLHLLFEVTNSKVKAT